MYRSGASALRKAATMTQSRAPSQSHFFPQCLSVACLVDICYIPLLLYRDRSSNLINRFKMPVQDPFQLPDSAQDLPLANDPNATYFLNFIASISPETNQPWCSDVRAALPVVGVAFSGENAPEVGFVHVGQKPEYVKAPSVSSLCLIWPFTYMICRWKDMSNVHRTRWNVNAVPTLVRYQRVDGEVKETGRLVEGELLDQKKLKELVGDSRGLSSDQKR
jgi:hypothetical protein